LVFSITLSFSGLPEGTEMVMLKGWLILFMGV
jgi:hypothetical protein